MVTLRSRSAPHASMFLALSVALAGCAPRTPPDPARPAPQASILQVGSDRIEMHSEAGTSEKTFGQPVANVWAVLPEVFEKLDVPVRLRTNLVQMGNQGYLARRVEGKRMSTWVDCGSSLTGDRADAYDITLQVFVTLQAAGPQDSRVVASVDALGKPRTTSGVPVHCNSKGTLEARILELVGASLVAAQGGGSGPLVDGGLPPR